MNGLVEIKKDEAVCTSLDVAEKFGKRHDHVLRDIESLMGGVPKIGETQMFKKSSYINEQNGQRYPMYYITRDGFSLLVMGFNGKKALEWKLKYIEAFNKMEKIILQKQNESWIDARQNGILVRKEECDVLKQLVEYAKEQGSEHSNKLYMVYSNLVKRTLGVEDREKASFYELNHMAMMEKTILRVIQECMAKGMHYKEIYKACKERLELLNTLAYLSA